MFPFLGTLVKLIPHTLLIRHLPARWRLAGTDPGWLADPLSRNVALGGDAVEQAHHW
jgi:hypothetical protein